MCSDLRWFALVSAALRCFPLVCAEFRALGHRPWGQILMGKCIGSAGFRQDGAKIVQDGSKMGQAGPKMAQDCAKMAQDGPRWLQDLPRCPQDCLKLPQDGPR